MLYKFFLVNGLVKSVSEILTAPMGNKNTGKDEIYFWE